MVARALKLLIPTFLHFLRLPAIFYAATFVEGKGLLPFILEISDEILGVDTSSTATWINFNRENLNSREAQPSYTTVLAFSQIQHDWFVHVEMCAPYLIHPRGSAVHPH